AGRRGVARELFERAAAGGFAEVQSDHTRLGSLMSLADACAELGDAERAEDLYAMMLPYTGMFAVPFLATICLGAVDRGLGTLAAVCRRWDEADTHFTSAAQLEEACKSPALLAVTLQRH